ncbi:MAG: hypothetical protein JW834_02010 [Candidatus Diapherotrites archaeon]|nr:hypothetical protein [Candidatus Diapherotrites archaeon]
MKLVSSESPRKVENLLIRTVVVDFVVMFFLLAGIGSGMAVYYEVARFPDVLLLIPSIAVIAFVLSVARFYSFLSIVIRVMGSLTNVFNEFGGGSVEVIVDVPAPFLLFGMIAARHFQASSPKEYSFRMVSDSGKYKVSAECVVQKGVFQFSAKVVDWHNLSHEKAFRGRVVGVQAAAGRMVKDIRAEVLEARGVRVAELRRQEEYYIPSSSPTVPVPAPEVHVPAGGPVPSAPIREEAAAKKALMSTEGMATKEEGLRAAVKSAHSKAEKDALQDALFELEEIRKVLKEK